MTKRDPLSARVIPSIVAALASLFGCLPAVAAAALPELPRTYIDTTYSPPSGNTITVNSGGNFQTALDNALPGDTIVLQAGATFTGPFTLPYKTGTAWIYIRSSNYASLPAPGNRVTPANAANMPTIVVGFGETAIEAANGAHNYRFVGIEIKPVTGNFVYNLVDLGAEKTSLSSLPTDIVFDRVYLHGDPTEGTRRGIAMSGVRVSVIDSYISDFKEDGADTQALATWNTTGPLKIVNNYLEGAGENFLTGGAGSFIPNAIPSDIEFRGNYVYKPLSWMDTKWTVKNLFELKNSNRVLIEGNVFENNWAAAQSGFAILMTVRNSDGIEPWASVQDITFRLNKVQNVASGINMTGSDIGNPSTRSNRILLKNNVIDRANGLGGGDNRLFQILSDGPLGGPVNVTIDHNTGFVGDSMFLSDNTPQADQFDFKNNLAERGIYGFFGAGTAEGLPALNAHYTNWTYTKNAQIGLPSESGSYPSGNFFPPSNAAVGFVNYGARDYRLSASSPYKNAGTDGKDLGADIDAVNTATACTVSGQCAGGAPLPSRYYSVTPCRIVDTRGPSGPFGGPALAAGSQRAFALAGTCNVPVLAKSVSANITVVSPTTAGDFRLYPADQAVPNTTTLSFRAGQTRANNALLRLAGDGSGGVAVQAAIPSGTAHIVIDVNGYFQ